MNSKSISSKYLFNSRYLLISLLSIIFLHSSCITQQNLEYLQGDIKAFNEADIDEYKLKPRDELYIQISSLDDPSASIFSSSANQQSTNIGTIEPYGASLISYAIDKDGSILLPVVGNIYVQDKTVKEVSQIITNSLTKILSQPMVSVKLVNRYVTVLGEIQSPGHYIYSQDKMTIYDAIGLAGDIMDYGNRTDVMLIRNKDGKNVQVSIDLTKSDLLASGYLYVYPNDIIYVKPLKKKFWGLRQFPYAIIISTVTAGILLYSVVK